MKNTFSLVFSVLIILVLITSCMNTSSTSMATIELTKELTEEPIQEPTKDIVIPKIGIGQTTTIDDFGEYTLKAAMLFDDIQVGFYNWEKQVGIKRLVFIFDGKNLTNQELKPIDFIKISTVYKDKYEYKTEDDFDFGVIDGNSWPAELMPLKVSEIYCAIDIPDEVAQSLENTRTTINLKGQLYEYDGEIENAQAYINQLREINNKLEEVIENLDSITTDLSFTFSPTREDIVLYSKRFADQKARLDKVRDILSKISPPTYYLLSHKDLVKGIDLLQSGLGLLVIDSENIDLPKYGQALVEAGTQINESETYIDKAKEALSFLD